MDINHNIEIYCRDSSLDHEQKSLFTKAYRLGIADTVGEFYTPNRIDFNKAMDAAKAIPNGKNTAKKRLAVHRWCLAVKEMLCAG